ncbi:Nucleotidylyl transferase [Rozella allomycis CSF55]|uniref:tryptophan--tRNA ligase n=1 Tax=Rozella allomycis (strain CSF55) TaxID=988480 RepID=A0A4P9YCK2_ROZAC|nr:Nucleotidylyl transferase [Rozella allomycis CSF55]
MSSQPTGKMHLGNYLGVIKNSVKLAKTTENFYFGIMDLHAYTSNKYSQSFIIEASATLLACGIPQKSLFVQSHNLVHANLSWFLSCLLSVNELNQMIQWKEKLKSGNVGNVGLFTYPILQAADILAYRATHVPIGEDQTQHMVLTRKLANKCRQFLDAPDYLPVPEAILSEIAKDPVSKMSKSDKSKNGCIFITDSPDLIRETVKRAKTDIGTKILYDPVKMPGVSNLMTILGGIKEMDLQSIELEYENLNRYDKFKDIVAELEYSRWMENKNEIEKILKINACDVTKIAMSTYLNLTNCYNTKFNK